MYEFIIFFFLILLSFFFSGYESAILSLRLSRLRELVRKRVNNSKIVLKFKNNQHKTIITLLIGNNLVNVAASALATKITFDYSVRYGLLEGYVIAIATGIMTFILLVFGEITPKTLAVKRAEKFALKSAKILLFFEYLFTPLRKFFELIAGLILNIFGISLKETQYYTAGEIREFVEMSHEKGAIKETEKEMIHNVLDFNDISVSEIMTPITKVVAIDSENTIRDLLKILVNDSFSRIPVYNKHVEDIIGVVYIKDIFPYIEINNLDLKVKDVCRKIIHVPASKKISTLFHYFKSKKEHIAVVVNEFGNTLGIITLEDVLEEIVGEIQDESDDEEENNIKRIDEDTLIVPGTVNVEEINELLKCNIKEDSHYQTIAGYVFYITGRIPKKGQVISSDGLKITIIDSDHKKINTLKIEKNNSFKKEVIESVDKMLK
ncbi:MAG: hemolysin [Candidatus Woesearchaeota archaeon]|nr:MAG: hemolysin [Candidatus Woesearchaeota archaeon]